MNSLMTVGELAKSVNVTVRTLQYYDKIGLLKPTKLSEGGRRLYTNRDISLLHQIITLKSLGLSLEEIKGKIKPINNNEDLRQMLSHQGDMIKEQISKSQKILESIHMIVGEIEHTDHIDWSKYANMVKMIQEDNEYYWIVNFLEKEMLEKIEQVHDSHSDEDLSPEWLKTAMMKAVALEEKGLDPHSDEAQQLAQEFWRVIQEYTKGEAGLIDQMYQFFNSGSQWPEEFAAIQKQSKTFVEKAIGYYLETSGFNRKD